MRIVVVTLLVLAVAGSVSAPAATATARLRVTDLAPFTIRGTGFKSHERVLLVAVAGGRYVRTVQASSAGSFSVVFRGVSVRGCQGYAVRATGNRGSRASVSFLPECPPPPRR